MYVTYLKSRENNLVTVKFVGVGRRKEIVNV